MVCSLYSDIWKYADTYSFNRLDLPDYKTNEELVGKLTIAVEETVGFGQE